MMAAVRFQRLGLHRQQLDMRGTAMQFLTANLGASSLMYAVLYSGPSEWVRGRRPPGDMAAQTSVVQHIESFGPYWPLFFGLAGFAVVMAAITCRGVVLAASLAVGVWAGYGIAILASAILTEPPTSLLAGFGALFISSTHFFTARHWAENGVK